MTKYVFFLCLLFMGFSNLTFAQNQDSIVKPDTAYLMDQIYRIDDGTGKTAWGFYENESKEWLTQPVYDSLIHRYYTGIEVEYYEIRQKGKWGLLHADRSAWVSPVYDKLDYEISLEPHRIFVEKGGKYGILNKDGSAWLEAIYDDILYDGTNFKVRKGKKWGILDSEGKTFLPICYDDIYEHRTPELSLLRNGSENLWSIFIWVQNTADPCTLDAKYLYERVEYFNEFFCVFKNGKWGLADRKGELVMNMAYEEMKPFVFSYLRTLKVKQNGKYGLIRLDSVGNIETMAPIIYDQISVDEENYKIKVEKDGKRDYLYNGEPYFGLIYTDVHYFLDQQIFVIKKGNKMGMTRENKEIVIEPKYESFLLIDNRTFMVKNKGKWGVINDRDAILIPLEFTQFDYRPDGGYFFAAKGDKWGVVSLKKGVVLPAKYEDVMILPNRNFLVLQKGKTGIVGAGGQVIVPLEYVDFSYKPGDTVVELKKANGMKFKYKLQ